MGRLFLVMAMRAVLHRDAGWECGTWCCGGVGFFLAPITLTLQGLVHETLLLFQRPLLPKKNFQTWTGVNHHATLNPQLTPLT